MWMCRPTSQNTRQTREKIVDWLAEMKLFRYIQRDDLSFKFVQKFISTDKHDVVYFRDYELRIICF